MGFIYAFIADWNFLFASRDKYAMIVHKYSKLLNDINNAEPVQTKWIRIVHFCKYAKNMDIEKFNVLADKWIATGNLIGRKGNEEMQIDNGIIYTELTSKLSVIVYPDNSALFMRKIAGSNVVTTAKLADIYNESESTKTMYLASESSAFDTLKKLRKSVEKIRLSEAVFENEMEDV